MDRLLDDLNEAQREAVLTIEGPVMAIAGAGSGKTSVLTRRIAYLIDRAGVPKENLLAITFTNKAANEMKTRIAQLLRTSTRGMWVSTFHSMCARILREHIEYLGYTRHFQIIDDDDVTQMIKIVMREQGIDRKLLNPNRIKPHILSLKADPARIKAYEEPLAGYLRKLFPLYQKRLKDNNLVDFEDLLILTKQILTEQDDVRRYYQAQFQYLLVDEFQDTNDLQYDLIRLLANQQENVFIVGDEDQSIYAFRGANIANIRRFQDDFTDPSMILLEQNYRSTNTILEAANQVIRGNKDRIEKNLYSTRGEGEKIVFYKGYTDYDEVEYITDTIRRLRSEGYRYKEMAILYRTNNISRLFEETFIRQHIPYKVVGSTSFFKRKEIKDIVAYLRLVINPHDDYSFRRVVNEPRRGIGAKSVERLADEAERLDRSLFETVSEGEELPRTGQRRLNSFKELIETLQADLSKQDFNTFIDTLIEKSGYRKMLEDDEQGDIRLENIYELKTMFKEAEGFYVAEDKETLLTYVLEDIALKSQEEEHADSDVLSLMTVHAAKGLEFRVVFVVALEQGLFPLHRSFEDPKQLSEERRLLYVALTRAMDRLYLSNARQRRWYGELVNNLDSEFVRAIDKSLLKLEGLNRKHAENEARYTKDYNRSKGIRQRRESLYEKDENALDHGDKINHAVFGEGVVISVSGEQCKVAFSHPHGIKTLMKNHPSITKKAGG